MKLTVIIPFLNAAPYLQTAAASCSCPTRAGEFQIILVDDGSTDTSPAIADSLSGDAITVIHQPNKGLGGARNTGIAAAKGDYVLFLDADDYLQDGAIDYLCSIIDEHSGADYITICSRHSSGGALRNVLPYALSARAMFLSDKWLDMSTVYVFRREFLLQNGLAFKEHLFFEDSEFTPRALYLASGCAVTNRHLYNILDHPGTITRSHSVRKSYDRVRVAESLKAFIDERVAEPECRAVFNRRMCVVLNRALWEIGFSGKEERRALDSYLSERKTLMRCFAESSIARYRFEHRLFALLGYSRTFRFLNVFKGI